MKKTLLLLTLLMTMLAFGVKAQVPVLTEGFESTTFPTGWTTIDANNDGLCWELSSVQGDLTTGHTGTGSVVSYSYNNATYVAVTPDNWLVSPAITLSGTSSLSYWFIVAASWPGDHYGVYISTTSATDTSAFTLLYETTPTSDNGTWTQHTVDLTAYAGNTVHIAFRHFNCSDQFLIALDDITVRTTTTTPTLAASPTSLSFGTIDVGSTAVQTVDVLASSNTTSISASVSAPFEVSVDSLSFGATATLPATGGTLYVKFAPTTGTAFSDVLSLTAGTLSATVNLSGVGLDCNPLALPYTETFETNSTHLGCWTVLGDGTWSVGTGDYNSSTGAFEGSRNARITHSSSGDVTKLISPALNGAVNGLTLTFAYVMRSWAGDVDELRVYSRSSANGTWQQLAGYTAATTTWTVENIIIPGNVYQVAFEMTDGYGYGVGIDSVVFVAMGADFCSPVSDLTASNITQTGATLTWSGNTNSYTILDMSDGSVVATVTDTFYVLSGLTVMTQYNYGVVANCPTTTSDTAVLSFATACATSVSLPFNETFNATSPSRNCWNIISMNTGNDFGTNDGMGFYTIDGREVLRFSSYNYASDYNQYGYSPLFDVSANATFLNVSVTYATNSGSDKLYFGYITPTDTVWDPAEYSTTGSSDWQTQTFVFPATATQLVVNYYGSYAYYAWIDDVTVTEMTGSYCFPVSNLTATDITAHGATLTWSGDANTYTILDMSDSTVVTTQADTTYVITGLTSETQYTYGVVANCTIGSSDTVTVSFTTQISCMVPTGLVATLTSGDGTVATLGWTENGTATAWQICLNGDTANLITATSNPYNFTGLTPETDYTVMVRANCDVNDQSAWSSAITFTPTNAYFLTVNDSTATNGNVPIYGYWVDNITKSQFIIPATDLTTIQYDTITKLTFYASNDDVNWGNAEFDVYMTETTGTSVAALADYTTMSQVYAGTLSISNNKMVVNFATPYVYMGGNLMIGFLQTVSGTWHSCTWYGVSATGASMGGYGTTISQQNFLPKTTINYIPGTTPACLPVTGLAASNVTDVQVTLTWSGTAASYNIYNGTTFVSNTTSTTYTVTGLTANTNYVFGVQAICSATDSAAMVNISVTTECADVTVLPYNEGFENGLGCWSTINASSDGQPWSVNTCANLTNVNPHSGTYVASSWSWSGSAMHANAWLISPKFVLPNVSDSLTFSWWELTNAGYPDSYSVVLSTTTNDTAAFTTVVYPYTAAAGTWTLRMVDLTAYAGQSVYLAFHHVDYDENYLLVDDISLFQGAYVPAAPDTLTVTFAVNDATMGTTVPAPGTYQYITGDTVSFHPEANAGYHFNNWEINLGGQVDTLGANYVSVYFLANSFMSYGTVTLTALFEADSTGPVVTCHAPTNVAVTNITESSADVSWTQEGDVTSWDVNYREAGATAWSTVTTSSIPHTLTGLAAETAYEVQVIANCIDGETSDPSSTATFTTLPVGIADYVLGRMVTLYPNPTTGLVQVQSAEGEVESVEVYDTYGKLLHTTKVSGGTATLNLSGYAKGTYFVKVTTDRGVVTKRVVRN